MNTPLHLTLIAGARPNFMKVASLVKAIDRHNERGPDPLGYNLVHTGQHFDYNMDGAFFEDLQIPYPSYHLGVGSGSQSVQTANLLIALEQHFLAHPTQAVVVVGDVNSTLAAALAAKKLNILVAHVEAGLESGDKSMPEEINRLATDAICDLFFTTTAQAGANLVRRGHPKDKIHFVGNTMIDTLINNQDRFRAPEVFDQLNLHTRPFTVVTLHRPNNVDSSSFPQQLLACLESVDDKMVYVFPVHPRTRSSFEGLQHQPGRVALVPPLRYLEFMFLLRRATCVVTDSGGIQEETTFLGVPCLTLRSNTERPETIEIGSNQLLGQNLELLRQAFTQVQTGQWKKSRVPELWDGRAGDRIVEILLRELAGKSP